MTTSKTPLLSPSIVDERTPCLFDQETLDSMDADPAEGTKYRRGKRALLAVSMVGTLVLARLSTQTHKFHALKTQSPTRAHDFLTFDDFLLQFDKTYPSNEDYQYRKNIYESNIDYIQHHNQNAEQHGWTMGVNKFADMQPHEIHKGLDKRGLPTMMAQLNHGSENNLQNLFGSLLGNNLDENLRNHHNQQLQRALSLSLEDLPDSVDWRTHTPPVVTPVKDQGHCGSCWAFAATAVLESHAAIATKELFVLSPQELVSCAPNPNHCGGDGGCTGSTGELAYEYVAEHGMVTEWEYGYTSYRGETGTCALDESSQLRKHTLVGAKVGLVGYSSLPTNSYEALMHALATFGPVVVSVAASGWGLYKGGVFDDFETADNYDINHAVVLEGYGTDEATGQDYWLVRNSWGVLWGEDGYIRLKREKPKEDDTSHCKMDVTPAHGVSCAGPDKNATIPDQLVCGTSGILYANVVPIGAYLIGQ